MTSCVTPWHGNPYRAGSPGKLVPCGSSLAKVYLNVKSLFWIKFPQGILRNFQKWFHDPMQIFSIHVTHNTFLKELLFNLVNYMASNRIELFDWLIDPFAIESVHVSGPNHVTLYQVSSAYLKSQIHWKTSNGRDKWWWMDSSQAKAMRVCCLYPYELNVCRPQGKHTRAAWIRRTYLMTR